MVEPIGCEGVAAIESTLTVVEACREFDPSFTSTV